MTGLPPVSPASIYRNVTSFAAKLVNMSDQFAIHALGYDMIAPAWLRYRVQGTPDLKTFVTAGQLSKRDIEDSLHSIDRRLDEFPRILDFGCGCGRTLRWMRDLVPGSALSGADVDGQAIEWCRNNIDFADFTKTDFQPPLPYADGSFDLVYALSVFTHLPMDAQFAWLEELKRILAPGGIAFLTVLGYRREEFEAAERQPPPRLKGERILASDNLDIWGFLEPGEIAQLETEGFAYIPYRDSKPDNQYGIAYHRPDFIAERFGSIMALKNYIPRGFCGYLDVALLQK